MCKFFKENKLIFTAHMVNGLYRLNLIKFLYATQKLCDKEIYCISAPSLNKISQAMLGLVKPANSSTWDL
jgi:hypothetical protein